MNSLETGFQLNDSINKEWEWKEKKTTLMICNTNRVDSSWTVVRISYKVIALYEGNKVHESVRNGFFTSLLEILKLLFKAALYVRSKLRPDLRVVSKQHKNPTVWLLLKKTLLIPQGLCCECVPHVADCSNEFFCQSFLRLSAENVSDELSRHHIDCWSDPGKDFCQE